MRLRLIIRRNGLPDSHILWNSTGLHNASSHNSTRTIADFLQEVDDVIPLESEEWGMEDYVVEVGGFEGVHFSVLDNILKEDDEVVIRPITTNDSRFRRVSGRVQISADGRRLFDGVAFGRPFVRKAPRPPVRIPWPKRARIMNDEEVQIQPDSPNQLILQDVESDDEEDSDYNEELNAQEIADLAAESVAFEAQNGTLELSNPRKRKRTGLGIQATIGRDIPRATSFGSSSTRNQGHDSGREGLWESPKNVRFEGEELDTPATVLAPDSSNASDSDESESSYNDNEPASPEADKENIAPGRLGLTRIVSRSSQAADGSSVESSDTTSSSGSDSDSDGDSSDTDSTSSFESSDESSDSAESFATVEREAEAEKHNHKTASNAIIEKQTALEQGPSEQPKNAPLRRVPAGQGMRVTQKRNARRKRKQQFDRAKSLGLLPPLSVESDKVVLDESQADIALKTSEQSSTDDLEQRKARLLQNLDIPSEEVPEETPETFQDGGAEASTIDADDSMIVQHTTILEPSSPPQEFSSKFDASSVQNSHKDETAEQEQQPVVDQNLAIQLPENNLEKQQTPRRAKLDIGSAKRMLFGSLGLRAPKSKTDADKLREELQEKARQLPGYILGRVEAKEQAPAHVPEVEIQDGEAWKDRIDLRAVECCYDGITYSKPPFPFVQRWDPQQQYQIGGKRKRGRDKRNDRNNKKYYQDSYEVEGYMDYDDNQEENYEALNPTEESTAFGYDGEMEQSNSDTYAANDQLLGEMQADTSAIEPVDDLPALPADMSTLQTLTQGTALPGCIIAFRQMEMSEQTQWSPIISSYKTAKIETVLENGVLEVFLAARDIQYKEKNYDSRTGQRIYSKFEMPVDEEEENERRLEIGLPDMIEPKLVQAAEDQQLSPSISSAVKAAADEVLDVLMVGKAITATMLTSTGQDKTLVELDGTAVELEKSRIPDKTLQVSTTTSRTESTLVASQESQPDIPVPSRWREASIELGSQNPPQRFFSEMRDGTMSSQIDEGMPSVIEEDNIGHVAPGNEDDNPSTSSLKHDDPSIWAHETENDDNDESTRFYSLNDGQSDKLPSSDMIENLDDQAVAIDITADADSSSEDGDSVIIHSRNRSVTLPAAAQALEKIESSLFVVDDHSGLQTTEESRDSEDESGDDTLLQGSMSKNKNGSTRKFENSDSDTESSSLPSLKDLLSRPIASTPKTKRVGNRKTKTSSYPKIPSATPEDVDAFVFSQAPKRFISNEDKMVTDLETESFLGSDDLEESNEPYELEAHVTDKARPKVESDEPQLPSILISHDVDGTSRKTRKNRLSPPVFQASAPAKQSNATNNMVVDLTLSSDTIDSNDDSSLQTKSTTGSMPSGPGWVNKPGRKSGSAAKTNSKSPRSSVRRKKSIV